MPDFDLDSALASQNPVCELCHGNLALTGLEWTDGPGSALVAVFRCMPCEEETDCTVYLYYWLYPIGVTDEAGTPCQRSPAASFQCPYCDSDADCGSEQMGAENGQVWVVPTCYGCGRTWRETYRIGEPRA